MKVLGIETSGDVGGVAVCQNKRIIIAKDFGGMQHGKELVPTIKSTLNEIGWAPKDIDLITVDVGPGSYTGLRVGVACAKTLAYALNKPVIDVPLFDIIAENYNQITLPIFPPLQYENEGRVKNLLEKNVHTGEYYICPILDARRNHVYACIYKFAPASPEQGLGGVRREKMSEFLVIQPEKLLSLLPRPVIIFGNGVAPYRDIFHQKDIFIDKEEWAIPKVEHVALLGERMFESGHQCEIDKLLPLYLRQAEAIEKREVKK
ncbi:MAG: tRNA (adenosine(37)-N6)-threonylcarbamoyltransferase complex dimerization subunit type 1 TsaB [Candidatus Brocadia sp.]|nr:tRNA (adenosine(37)-N6)-threonylcarbamoyltransferase complex dimerization subunit type 1 TsaB [Candidatus Brocadia sp.]